MTWRLEVGDCLDVMRTLEANSVDAMVTDPPAGIGFMGEDWDHDKGGRGAWVEWMSRRMMEARRVLKPGAHCLIWAIPRHSHWTATALEDAGFEIRDVITHHFGSGFPKSLDVRKALDASQGAKRVATGRDKGHVATAGGAFDDDAYQWPGDFERHDEPSTDLARQWAGWGTALKPASEHWILARVPVEGTIVGNLRTYGTGAINIDASRSGATDTRRQNKGGADDFPHADDAWRPGAIVSGSDKGRWPPNLVLSHAADCGDVCAPDCPVAAIDAQSGATGAAAQATGPTRTGAKASPIFGGFKGADEEAPFYGDEGGASRFFPTFRPVYDLDYAYIAKPAVSERDRGLEAFGKRTAGEVTDRVDGTAGISPRAGARAPRRNVHPTVKSVALMTWLCRLVTPPQGVILDPFAGSGTTVIAALRSGFSAIAIEVDADYAAIARARILGDSPLFNMADGTP